MAERDTPRAAGAPAGAPTRTVDDEPAPARGRGHAVGFTAIAPAQRGEGPRTGLGMLIPGVMLLAGLVGVIVSDVVFYSRNGGCDVCIPISAYAVLPLSPGFPLTIAGGIRFKRYRDWKNGWTFTPRPAGFILRF